MNPTSHSTSSEFSMADIHQPKLKVIGLGGGGCNAVERMIELGLRGIDFIAANTDHQALEKNPAPTKIQLGPKTTRGLGAGGDPRVGKAAAEESSRQIAAALEGADMVFLTAGMGGGTGTGSIPVAAEIARSVGAVTIAVVTTPFSFEMGRRQRNAREGLALLSKQTHTLVSIPNDRLLYVAPRNLPLEVAFRLADDVLRQSVQGVTELITESGMINVDFAHIKRLIQLGGGALMSIGHGRGETKVDQAIEQALHHPLLESVSLGNAAGVIANFTGGQDLTLLEVEAAINKLRAETGAQTEIVLGVINDNDMEDRTQVILVITGLGAPTLEEAMSGIKQLKPAVEPQKAPAPQAESPAPLYTPQPEAPYFNARSEEPRYTPRPEPRSIATQAAIASTNNLDMPAFLRRRANLGF